MLKGFVNEHGLDKSILENLILSFLGHFHIKSDDGHIYYLVYPI